MHNKRIYFRSCAAPSTTLVEFRSNPKYTQPTSQVAVRSLPALAVAMSMTRVVNEDRVDSSTER